MISSGIYSTIGRNPCFQRIATDRYVPRPSLLYVKKNDSQGGRTYSEHPVRKLFYAARRTRDDLALILAKVRVRSHARGFFMQRNTARCPYYWLAHDVRPCSYELEECLFSSATAMSHRAWWYDHT
jgi:hypothetical protein